MSRQRGKLMALALLSAFAFTPSSYAQTNSAASPTGIKLPASFTGTTPCADCTGIKQALTLRRDGLYILHRQYLGKKHGASLEHGLWTVDASGKNLTLHNGNAITQQMMVTDKGDLRLLDQSGAPIGTHANIDLHRMSRVAPMNKPLHWRGEFQYTAASATFTDCASGLRWPITGRADFLKAERQYQQSHQPVLINFSGRLAIFHAKQHAPREQIVIDRFNNAEPGAVCGKIPVAKTGLATGNKPISNTSGIAKTSLKNTDWKLIKLNGNEIDMPSTQIQGIRIKFADDGSSIKGFAGCNQINGNYQQGDSALHFSQIPNILRTCESPLMDIKSQVLQKILNTTTAYRIEDQHLILLNGDQEFAQFEMMDLP